MLLELSCNATLTASVKWCAGVRIGGGGAGSTSEKRALEEDADGNEENEEAHMRKYGKMDGFLYPWDSAGVAEYLEKDCRQADPHNTRRVAGASKKKEAQNAAAMDSARLVAEAIRSGYAMQSSSDTQYLEAMAANNQAQAQARAQAAAQHLETMAANNQRAKETRETLLAMAHVLADAIKAPKQ